MSTDNTELLFPVETAPTLTDTRRTWDDMVEKAKANPGVKHTLVLPQDVMLISPMLKTVFTQLGGGQVSVTIGDGGYWAIESKPTPVVPVKRTRTGSTTRKRTEPAAS